MELMRYDIINFLAKKINAQRYLEIGVRNGTHCFDLINIPIKDGVDPNPVTHHTKFKLTSDEFFAYLNPSIKYDIIFIDGLHIHDQVNRDIVNSFNHLNDNGFVVIHDTNPPTEDHAREEVVLFDWNGTVYRSIMEVRATREDIETVTVNTDWGVSILKKGAANKVDYKVPEDLNWEVFNSDRVKALGLISVAGFYKHFNSM